MLTDAKIPSKVANLEKVYEAYRFAPISTIVLEMAETQEHFRVPPPEDAGLKWQPVTSGHHWGDNWVTGWFRGSVTLTPETAGQCVFVRIETGAPESMLLVNGQLRGVFDVNHPVRLLSLGADAGTTFQIHVEAYAGHSFPGTQPYAGTPMYRDGEVSVTPGCRTVGKAELLVEREDVSAFIFELRALHQLTEALEVNSLRRAQITAAMAEIHSLVYAKPEEACEKRWRPALAEARKVMRPLLERRNGPTTPQMGIIGHSHIDSAWLWPISETWRKCARTFSSILSLMDQYPEFRFTQSAAYHSDVVRRLYPEVFQRIQQRVREGRWEINGAMWVEPDCNIPSGESFIRQCLMGQRATREMFGVTSDTLWQPDVFGYSAALPQILRGCGVSFFCTTKLSWNDTNLFPYDTFQWQGIDGSTVMSHFNTIHCWPDPKTLVEHWNQVRNKDVQDRRLVAFGFGDGGGGPQAEMIEMGRLTRDLEGCPKAEYTSISQFMQGCRDELKHLPLWVGELYLELHRGTLTSIARLKRGNRICEFALRDAELAATLAALQGQPYPHKLLHEAWRTLLTNQFHDILPGSSIARVNDEATLAFEGCQVEAQSLLRSATDALTKPGSNQSVLLLNSLSWQRDAEVELTGLPEGRVPETQGAITQAFSDVSGTTKVAATGLTLPALGYAVLPLTVAVPTASTSPFRVDRAQITTPFARVTLGQSGEIVSFVDTRADRELIRSGGAFNRLLLGEDVPKAWDNWDIDRDQRLKLHASAQFLGREVVSSGPLQLRIRSRYRLGESSMLTQDMVFHSTTARVDFDTIVEWHEKYQLLKVGFAVDVLADTARHEIQFGHITRSTHDNTSWDRAQFDVCAHKWTDISEGGYGVAFLNDCKYACTVKEGEYRLTLIKSGRHPDPRGDEGTHRFAYALLPHQGTFSVESVVRPAYEFNLAPRALVCGRAKGADRVSLLEIDMPNVIVEAVKYAEDHKAVIVRLYEASRTGTHAELRFGPEVSSVTQTNMLEEPQQELALSKGGGLSLYFRAFEIKTLLVKMR